MGVSRRVVIELHQEGYLIATHKPMDTFNLEWRFSKLSIDSFLLHLEEICQLRVKLETKESSLLTKSKVIVGWRKPVKLIEKIKKVMSGELSIYQGCELEVGLKKYLVKKQEMKNCFKV